MERNIRVALTVLAIALPFNVVKANDADTLDVVRLQEVEVLSLKDNAGMSQMPVSSTHIGLAQMEQKSIVSLKSLRTQVPNLFIPDYGSRLTSAIYIRGIGSRINTPVVGLYVDDIPYVDKSAFDFNLYGVESIDVLRGPQGTLYGRNTMGGLIRVRTRNPFAYQGTDVKLGYATGDNHRQASLTHHHRVSDSFAFSVGGYYEGSNGFFVNDFTGNRVDDLQSGGGRLRAMWLPSDRWKLDMSVGYDYSDEGAYPYYYTGTLAGEEQYKGLIGTISNNRDNRYRRGLLNAGLNAGYVADTWQVNAITGYQHLTDRMFMDQDFIAADIYTLEQKQHINTLTEEVIFKNRGNDKWQWITGLNLMGQWLHTEGPVNFYGDGLRWLESNINSVLPSMDRIPMLQRLGFSGMSMNFRGDNLLMAGSFETPAFEAAAFHQSTLHLTDRFSATLGIRVGFEHLSMNYDSPAHVDYGFRMPNDRMAMMAVDLQQLVSDLSYKGTKHDNRFMALPKLSLKYDFDSANNIYASFAMGQRSGGYNLQMFSDLLQGAMRVDMMNGIKNGVGDYLDELSARVPAMPKAIPDPDNAGQMISIPDYVRRVMGSSMPATEMPTTDQVVYKPEFSLNYEVGTHLSLLDHTLRADAAVFYNRIYDQQIARFAPTGLGRMMVNAGKSQSYGGELSLRYTPDSHLAVTGNYGYTYSTFLEYDAGGADADHVNDYSGCYVPFVPMHTMNLDVAYTWHIGRDRTRHLTLGADCSGVGRTYWNESNTISQPFYALLGARLVIEMGDFSVMLWGRNLTDTRFNTFCFESAGRGFEQHGKPLQIGIDLGIHF